MMMMMMMKHWYWMFVCWQWTNMQYHDGGGDHDDHYVDHTNAGADHKYDGAGVYLRLWNLCAACNNGASTRLMLSARQRLHTSLRVLVMAPASKNYQYWFLALRHVLYVYHIFTYIYIYNLHFYLEDFARRILTVPKCQDLTFQFIPGLTLERSFLTVPKCWNLMLGGWLLTVPKC